MTVERLMRKLIKLPKDLDVVFANNEIYVDAKFIATGTKVGDGYVEIISDYEHMIDDEDEEDYDDDEI